MSRWTLVVAMGCCAEEAQMKAEQAERHAGIDVTQVGASVRISAPVPGGLTEVTAWVSIDGDEQELTAIPLDGFVDLDLPIDPCSTFGREVPVAVAIADLDVALVLAMHGAVEADAGTVDELTAYCDPGPYRVQVAVDGDYEVTTDGVGIVWSRADGAGWATSGGRYEVHIDAGTYEASAGDASYLVIRRM